VDLCKKKTGAGSPQDSEQEVGPKWIWTAIDTSTRVLIAFWIGRREIDDARQLVHTLCERGGDQKPLFVSDELSHYGTVLEEVFHQEIPPLPTGKRGRPTNPVRVIDPDLIYATVHKTREKGRVVKVERRVVYGSESNVQRCLADSPSRTINTAYVERTNLDWRLWDAHLTRKAPTFARALPWLRAKFAITVAVYNFVRPHETLSRGTDRIFRPMTPVMAANVTEHPWTVLELISYPVVCQ